MGCNRISELPDFLLTQILVNLPTIESVRTSVLSKRWQLLWLRVPGLDFEYEHIHGRDFKKFMEKFMEFNHESRMQKFTLLHDINRKFSRNQFAKWICTAVDRGVEHLHVAFNKAPTLYKPLNMPHNFYKSKTLVSLKLVDVRLENQESVVYLPCLKIMHLENIWYSDDPLNMQILISGCPVLEDLTLINPVDGRGPNILLFLRVRSQTLKSLCFMCSRLYKEFEVEIDAPQLIHMSWSDIQSYGTIVVKNLSSLFMIDIDSDLNVDYLTGISSVRRMIISQRSLEALHLYSKPIPKFDNLYRLEAAFSGSTLRLLPAFLESCPNLKDLTLGFSVWTEREQTELTYVPQCLLSTLECVEIEGLIIKDETGMKVAKYFLENSVVLKKLILSFKYSYTANQDSGIFEELDTLTKRSRKCQIIIHFDDVIEDQCSNWEERGIF